MTTIQQPTQVDAPPFPEDETFEQFAEALHRGMWGINIVEGMKSRLGVHVHTMDRQEVEAQREFIRRCLRYADFPDILTTLRDAVTAEAQYTALVEQMEALAQQWECPAHYRKADDEARTNGSLIHVDHCHGCSKAAALRAVLPGGEDRG